MTIGRSVAAAQTTPAPGDVDANVSQHLRLARAAADEQVQLLVFPELSLTGYELQLADELAFSESDRRLAPLFDVADALSMILIAGAPVRIGSQLHIGAFVISPNGAVDVHTKHYLGAFSSHVSPDGIVPPPEDTVFHPGSRKPLVRFHGNTAAVGVCAESLQALHPKDAADRGANTYLTSHFGIPLDVAFRAAVLQGHAVRHSMVVVFSNYGGPTGGLPGGGKSAVWSERGELLAELGATGSGVVIASEGHAGWQAKTLVLGSP